MKKIVLFIALCTCAQIHAQISQGTITYAMELMGGPGGNINAGSVSATIYFKNEKSLTEMITPAYTMRILSDEKGILTLMETRGKKTYSMKSKSDIEKQMNVNKGMEPSVQITKEKKTILGYPCTKANISMPGNQGDTKMSVWFSDKIKHNSITLGGMTPELAKKLNGMMLEVDVEQGAIQSRIIATRFNLAPVPDKVFALSPVGYTPRK